VNFGWDEKKAEENLRDHGVAFDEAQEVFVDRNAIDIFDSEHSTPQESRYTIRPLIPPPPFCCVHRIGGQDDLAHFREKSRSQVQKTI